MEKTEMSLQSDLIKSESISSYSKIEIKEDSYNDNNYSKVINNPSEIISEGKKDKNIVIINGKSYTVNSDQVRPITHKYKYSKLGNTYTFFADEKGNPLIIIGPHWPLALGVIICFSVFFFSVTIYFRKFISYLSLTFGYLLYLFFLISYLLTALINPGYPKHDENALYNKNKDKSGFCLVCNIYLSLEKKTKHCQFCNICVEGMDHHCPWTGKCIGKKNLIPFYLFVLSVFFFIVYCTLTIINCKDSLNKDMKK